MAGYSITPLFKKLGLKEGQSIRLIHPPADYAMLVGEAINSLIIKNEREKGLDFIHLFTNSAEELEDTLPGVKDQIKKSGAIWISWYKKSAKKETELTENKIRDIALANGLVDVKVCAIDDSWSGLKLVFRLSDR